MKAYVVRYEGKPEEELAKRQFPYGDNIDVLYDMEPKWVMAHVQEAESECLILHRMHTHVGAHICQFSVEEQPKGGFAVVCKEHPDWERGDGKQ